MQFNSMFLHTIDNETSLFYSAIQNDISFPESSGGAHIDEWQQGGNVEPCDSELSSASSPSENLRMGVIVNIVCFLLRMGLGWSLVFLLTDR